MNNIIHHAINFFATLFIWLLLFLTTGPVTQDDGLKFYLVVISVLIGGIAFAFKCCTSLFNKDYKYEYVCNLT
jgi:hypothetical protein